MRFIERIFLGLGYHRKYHIIVALLSAVLSASVCSSSPFRTSMPPQFHNSMVAYINSVRIA